MAFADLVRFLPTLGGTTDFVYSSTVGGCQSPSQANVQNGVTYKCYAVSSDLTQWEIFQGAYTSSTGTFARTTVLYNSSATGTATGQSGAGTKISFSTVPQVSIIAAAEDLVPQSIGQLPGTATNDSASAGNVGEFVSSSVASGAAIGLTTGVAANVTSISLTAGDWEVEGVLTFSPAASTTVGAHGGGVTTSSATAPSNGVFGTVYGYMFNSAINTVISLPTGRTRISINATTTVFLVAFANFSTSTLQAYGGIRARRVR